MVVDLGVSGRTDRELDQGRGKSCDRHYTNIFHGNYVVRRGDVTRGR
jgi:hypothetical protein